MGANVEETIELKVALSNEKKRERLNYQSKQVISVASFDPMENHSYL
jgi:hypothetical protein